ncbi:MAG: MAPEG family protein [Sandaracinobacter sp.]
MDFAYPFAALGTGLAILIYVWTGLVVGKARKAHGVDYPNTIGNDAFNRIWRAHANTLEALPQFLPSLWLFAVIISDMWAGILALVWAVGRILYVQGYTIAADKRGTGFMIALAATAIALLGSMGMVLWQLIS